MRKKIEGEKEGGIESGRFGGRKGEEGRRGRREMGMKERNCVHHPPPPTPPFQFMENPKEKSRVI